MGVSGWNWDPKKGVNVTPATRGTWDDWVRKNKGAGRFRNKGWPHYERLLLLMPEKAKGGNVFRAGTVSAEREKSPSPDWDYGALDRDFGDSGDGGEGEKNTGGDDDESVSPPDENDNDEMTGVRTSFLYIYLPI